MSGDRRVRAVAALVTAARDGLARAPEEVLPADLARWSAPARVDACAQIFACSCALAEDRGDLEDTLGSLPALEPTLRRFLDWAAGALADAPAVARARDRLRERGAAGEAGRPETDDGLYEELLAAIDPAGRRAHGVYYTPPELVRFVLRGVDELHRRALGRGLEDMFFESCDGPRGAPGVLDPAVGAAAFPVALIRMLHARLSLRWSTLAADERARRWRAFARERLLPRLYGLELLPAAWAVAALRISATLSELGVAPAPGDRLRLLRRDALRGPWGVGGARHGGASRQEPAFPGLARPVIIGNPPYRAAPGERAPWIRALLRGPLVDGAPGYFEIDGAPLRERTSKWLNDDYVAFMRQAQAEIAGSGAGVLGFAVNHGFLTNPTFRGMRRSLLHSFSAIELVDLHGNSKRRERAGPFARDENVFGVQQGVCVAAFARAPGRDPADISAGVRASDLHGPRPRKLARLEASSLTDLQPAPVRPRAPLYLLTVTDRARDEEYAGGLGLDALFPVQGVGLTTARDRFVIDRDPEALLDRVRRLRDATGDATRACHALGIRTKKGWDPERARARLRADCPDEPTLRACLRPILYRPFDRRTIFYHPAIVWRTAERVTRHMRAPGSVALVSARTNKSPVADHFFCARSMIEAKCGESTTQSRLFPLWLAPREPGGPRRPNLHEEATRAFARDLELARAPAPDELLAFLYAQVFSSGYRSRYATRFAVEFPRVFRPRTPALLRELVALGRRLLRLHAPPEPAAVDAGAGAGAPVMLQPRREGGVICLNEHVTIPGVSAEVWAYTIGGHRVVRKWLKARAGQPARPGELAALRAMIDAIHETRARALEIDAAITRHGGWPAAFQPWRL